MAGRILIIGGDSVVGAALARQLRASGQEVLTTTRRKDSHDRSSILLDLAKPVDRWNIPKDCEAAVFCAAVGNLQTCFDQPFTTRLVNVKAPSILARQLAETGTFCLFLSTNMIYNGANPLVNSAEVVSPVVEYAHQKVEAERLFLQLKRLGAVVRLTKVFHSGMPLISGWINKLAAGDEVEAFNNYFCSPLALDAVAEGLARVIEQRGSGIWQFSPPDQLSYLEIARLIAANLGVTSVHVRGTTCSATVKHTPRFTSLDASRAYDELNLKFATSAAVIQKTYFS